MQFVSVYIMYATLELSQNEESKVAEKILSEFPERTQVSQALETVLELL